jgi:hypothetical protein
VTFAEEESFLSLLLRKFTWDPLFIKTVKVNSTGKVSTSFRQNWNSQAFKDGLGWCRGSGTVVLSSVLE